MNKIKLGILGGGGDSLMGYYTVLLQICMIAIK